MVLFVWFRDIYFFLLWYALSACLKVGNKRDSMSSLYTPIFCALSISSVAVELAASVAGDIGKCRVLLIGAGEAGKLVARSFAQKGVKRIAVASRSQSSAEELAASLGGVAIDTGRIQPEMEAADVVISTGPSNVLVEAGIAGVPPALFELRGYGFDRTPPFVIEPDKQSIIDTVNHLTSSDEWQQKRAAFVRRYAFRDDGRSSERALRQIKRIINV